VFSGILLSLGSIKCDSGGFTRLIVAIIGGAGRMGSWFARYFLKHGCEVLISDLNVDRAELIAKSLGVRMVKSNVEAASIADLTLVSAPIDVTPTILLEIMPYLKEHAIVAEVSSLKSRVLPALKRIAERGVKSLSIHPLFGSGARDMVGGKIALIPVIDRVVEEDLTKRIFPEAEVIVVDCETHDEVMALTLALTHFINIVFASVVGEEDIRLLRSLGGTTFTLQLTLSEAVMSENPSLYASIQMDNECTVKYLDKFMSRAEKLRSIIESKNFDGFIEFFRLAQGLLSKDEGFAGAYERMYRALESI